VKKCKAEKRGKKEIGNHRTVGGRAKKNVYAKGGRWKSRGGQNEPKIRFGKKRDEVWDSRGGAFERGRRKKKTGGIRRGCGG